MEALARSNGGSKEKVTKADKSILFWDLKAILECYMLALQTVAVKCKSWFPVPLKLFIFSGREYSGKGAWVSTSLNPL